MKSNSTQHYEECSVCKGTRNRAGHSFSYKVTKTATCTSTGTKTGTCSKCSYKVTQTVAKVAHKARGWQQGPKDGATHYKVCNTCAKELEGTRENHKYDSNGKCTVCGILKEGCMHKSQKMGNCLTDTICTDCNKVIKKAPGHDYRVQFDDNSHFERCYNCHDKKNVKNHKFEYGNGKDAMHEKSCVDCKYVVKAPHAYNVNSNICILCGYEKLPVPIDGMIIEEYSPDSVEDNKELQRLLSKLGYYTGSIDGKMGPGTRRAINKLIEDQGFGRRLGDDAGWDAIDTNMYTFIMNQKETAKEAYDRRFSEKLATAPTVLNAEQSRRFDELTLVLKGAQTGYSQDSRMDGVNTILNADGSLKEAVAGETLYFDCSSLGSTYMYYTCGIDCDVSSNYVYSTGDFIADKENFDVKECNAGIDPTKLKKGQMIVCMDNKSNDSNHVVICLGNGEIIHSSSSNGGVVIGEASSYFVSGTKYNETYLVTPKSN